MELFKELFIENYSKNKINFIPRHYLINPLYPECDIDTDGELIEDVSEYTNYCQCSYNYEDNETRDVYRDILDNMDMEELNSMISETLSQLNEREQIVIRMRFGLNDENTEYTLDEIGKELHMSRESVRRTELSAINKLKHPKVNKRLKAYHDENYEDGKRFKRYFMVVKENIHTRFMFIADYIVKYFINKNNREIIDGDYTAKHMERHNLILISHDKIELFRYEFSKLLLEQSNKVNHIEINSNLHYNLIYKVLRSIGIYHNYFIPEDMMIKIDFKYSLVNVLISLENVEYILYPDGGLKQIDFK